MRTLEKMSTRFVLRTPLVLLGLFLRRLVVGRSKCCSRACLFCLISPLAIAAAMAQSHTTVRVQSAHGAQTTQTAASRSSQPGSQSHSGGWVLRSVMCQVSRVRAGYRLMSRQLHDNHDVGQAVILGHRGEIKISSCVIPYASIATVWVKRRCVKLRRTEFSEDFSYLHGDVLFNFCDMSGAIHAS